MPWPGVEIEEVCVPDPISSVVVGDYLVTITARRTGAWTGLVPLHSSYTIMHIPSESVRVFTGLEGYTKTPNSLGAFDGKAWIVATNSGLVGSANITYIDPVGGAVTDLGGSSTATACLGGLGVLWLLTSAGSGQIYGRNALGGAVVSVEAVDSVHSAMGVLGGYLYTLYYGTLGGGTASYRIGQFDPSTGLLVNHWASPVNSFSSPLGVEIDGALWWRGGGGVVGFEPVGGPIARATSPIGCPGGSKVVAHNGLLCEYVNAGDHLDSVVVIDPHTGEWAVDSLAPTRGRRSHVVSAGGHLWVPSGEPTGETP